MMTAAHLVGSIFLIATAAVAAAETTTCPLGSMTVNGVALGVPTTPLNWCFGANTTVRPNGQWTMVGVNITPAGDNFLSQHGRDLWQYLDIRSAIVPGTTGTIFEQLFGMTYQQYSAIPAVQKNQARDYYNKSIVYFTPKDLAKIWIVTTDGTPGVSSDVITSNGGYASAAATVAVAGQESGGQNAGAYTFLLANDGRAQFNSPITALDPVFPMNPAHDNGTNGGFWQVSNFATTPDVLPCFTAAGWQGTSTNMEDAKTAMIYNPFFQAKVAMFWATKRLGTTTCTNSSNTACQPNQPSCTGTQWTDANPKCLAGALCKGDGIWNAPLVDCMFNILAGTNQPYANGFPISIMAQHGAYLAALDLMRAQPPFVPTAPSSWSTDANFNTAAQSMPRFVERPCCDDSPCPTYPGYASPCSSLPYWTTPSGNKGGTCGGQDCLNYRQSFLGGFPIPGVPSATVIMVGTILLPPGRRRLPEAFLEGGAATEAVRRAKQQQHRRLPTINLDLDYSTGLCPTPPGPNAVTSTIQFTVNWQTGPSFLEQLRAFIAAQASQGVTICSLDTVILSYPPFKACKALVQAEKATARQQCAAADDACRKAVRQTYRAHLRACERGYKFCRATAKDQRAAALRACKRVAGPGFGATGSDCRRNATRTYKSLVGTC